MTVEEFWDNIDLKSRQAIIKTYKFSDKEDDVENILKNYKLSYDMV